MVIMATRLRRHLGKMAVSPIWIFLGLAVFAPSSHADLTPASDSELRNATGQEGAALELELHWNDDVSSGSDKPYASLSNCSGTGNPCTLALQYINQNGNGTAANQQWLVYKDFYGRIFIPNLYLDATTTPLTASVPSTPQPAKLGATWSGTASPSSISTMANLGVFKSASGICLLNCTGSTPNPYGIPALQLSMQNYGAPPGGSPTLLGSSYTSDNPADFDITMSFFLNVGRMAIEYGPDGYKSDADGSFQSLSIGSLTSTPTAPFYNGAKINIMGRAIVYGF